MITLFQIDKSGRDIFEKDYSIIMIVNKEDIYGINIPQKIKDVIMHLFRQEKLWKINQSEKRNKMRLRVRFHTAIIIMLVKKAITDYKNISDVNIEICNDFDGHFHEIKDMIYKNLSKTLSSIKPEDIIQTKFQKPSKIDSAGREIRAKSQLSQNYHLLKPSIEELIKILKK